jgi:hypothetical protein
MQKQNKVTYKAIIQNSHHEDTFKTTRRKEKLKTKKSRQGNQQTNEEIRGITRGNKHETWLISVGF